MTGNSAESFTGSQDVNAPLPACKLRGPTDEAPGVPNVRLTNLSVLQDILLFNTTSNKKISVSYILNVEKVVFYLLPELVIAKC